MVLVRLAQALGKAAQWVFAHCHSRPRTSALQCLGSLPGRSLARALLCQPVRVTAFPCPASLKSVLSCCLSGWLLRSHATLKTDRTLNSARLTPQRSAWKRDGRPVSGAASLWMGLLGWPRAGGEQQDQGAAEPSRELLVPLSLPTDQWAPGPSQCAAPVAVLRPSAAAVLGRQLKRVGEVVHVIVPP